MERPELPRLPYFLLQEVSYSLRRLVVRYHNTPEPERLEILKEATKDLTEAIEFYTNTKREPSIPSQTDLETPTNP